MQVQLSLIYQPVAQKYPENFAIYQKECGVRLFVSGPLFDTSSDQLLGASFERVLNDGKDHD
jgi:hypothetical protein